MVLGLGKTKNIHNILSAFLILILFPIYISRDGRIQYDDVDDLQNDYETFRLFLPAILKPLDCTDADSDGFAIEGGACGAVDCNDMNPQIHPRVVENCVNEVDDNCDHMIDDDDPNCSDPMNIIVIGWDGTQRDHFWQCYNRELPECADGLLDLQSLSRGVIFDNTITNGATDTKSGWAQILSGYHADVTGVFNNGDYQPIPEGYTVFEKVENHFGADNVVTIFVSGKGVHTGGACIGDPTYKDGLPVIEDKGQPWCLTKDHIDYFEVDQFQNEEIGNRALELLETHQHNLVFAFFLFRDPDVTGHLEGEDSLNYSLAIKEVDSWLGIILNKLEDLDVLEQTLVYVTSDHGFDEGESVHLNAPYTLVASNDPLLARSGDRLDVAPTILARLGISPGRLGNAPPVDGYSLFSVPPLGCIPKGEAYVDYPGAPACCSDLTLIGLDKAYGSICYAPSGGVTDNPGYCTSCGNDVCEEPENQCNCPIDCIP